MPRPRATALIALSALVGLGAGLPSGAPAASSKSRAHAAKGTATKARDLWATVNICDSADHPETIGIRGSMPGFGRKGERMYMRFQLQFFDQQEKEWHNIGDSGDSDFVPVGSGARRKARESGRNFTVRAPRTGAFYLRGAVTFEWRKDGEVVRRFRRRTTSKHPGTAGADPARFSASKCILRAG